MNLVLYIIIKFVTLKLRGEMFINNLKLTFQYWKMTRKRQKEIFPKMLEYMFWRKLKFQTTRVFRHDTLMSFRKFGLDFYTKREYPKPAVTTIYFKL